MGARKRKMAENLKKEKRSKAIAKLNDCPTSPRKMRLVADLIRGVEVNRAMDILRFSKKEASTRLEKLVKSAINNWEAKNEDLKLDNVFLYVKEIFVNQGRTIKRMHPASRGRTAIVRKRSNHVTVVLDVKIEETNEKTEE
ncbi:MAG: 50S ribosomal protein L22 [Prevotellaceae bacterium]|jgi:large subunit ribosomal protein L22|nr:50S ribosomal protein L22 [Prevotellaceae bacterium]